MVGANAKRAYRKAIKWGNGLRVGRTMSWEMTLFGRDAAYIVRNPARDGKHRYSYTAYFYEYVTRDITATRTFHSLADAKGYIEHYIGA